jgi:hypothetical protein
MNRETKYIVTDKNDFAIFTDLSKHSDVARSLFGKPVGAGFCRIQNNRFICYGESVSLNLESRLKDEDIINGRLLR